MANFKSKKTKNTKIVRTTRTFSPKKKKSQATAETLNSTDSVTTLQNSATPVISNASSEPVASTEPTKTNLDACATETASDNASPTLETSSADKEAYTITPYAFIRFSNEQITLKACLNSIKGFFQRGILCYHPTLPGIEEDNSLAIAQDFVEQNPGFRLVKYPFPVIYHNSEVYYDRLSDLERNWLLDSFSTFALLHLKQLIADYNDTEENAFIFKVDADHVYSQKALENMYSYALAHPQYDLFLCYQYNVVRNVNEPMQTPWFIGLENTWDHIFVRANKIKSFTFVLVQDPNYTPGSDLPYGGFERIVYDDNISICLERYFVNSIHFNREKFLAYNDPTQEEIAKIYSKGFPYEQLNFEDLYAQAPDVDADHEFFSPNFVYSLLVSFDYSAVKPHAHLGRKYGDIDALVNDPQYRISNFVEKFNIDNGLIDQGKITLDKYELYLRILTGRFINQMYGAQSILKPVIRQPNFGSVEDEIKQVLAEREQKAQAQEKA